ncbi:hypothetical protein G6F57_021152 [Rhizopus arrhizus]|nr:hypothetical protein G6F33_013952 [Rhizopus arrhizus]KAG0971802.1 hypothetical protein G6F29_013889 [Rhizopus arrhizus]KAG1435385.1 hypothetical protein G6F57_021152 [Rhizopus arrhizus]
MVDKANGKAVATPTSACRSRVNAKLLNRRIAYNANAAAYHARFPFAEKILTVDWTSDEEDGPEDEDGRTFIVKRPSFRSERVSTVADKTGAQKLKSTLYLRYMSATFVAYTI